MKYDVIIIGFGQGAGKIIAKLSRLDWKIALIEKNPYSYGGSCINIGCIPSKMLDHDARAGVPYSEAVERRNHDIAHKRQAQKASMEDNPQVDLYTGLGSFEDNHTVKVELEDETVKLTADYIIIDTGSTPVILPMEGWEKAHNIYTSTTLQTRQDLPKRLGVIGDGNIGLEFASIYANFGSQVDIFAHSSQFMSEEEAEIAERIELDFNAKGITIHRDAEVTKVKNDGETVIATTKKGESYRYDALLVATGRKPNIENLGLENTEIEVSDKEAVQVDDHLQTAVKGVYAIGDVRGEEMFTYITNADAEIVLDHLVGEGNLLLSDRKNVPYATFIDPPLSRVGLTEEEAKEEGYSVLTNQITLDKTPTETVLNDDRGLFKAVVNETNQEILGVSLYGPHSPELINQIKMAMDNQIPYTYIRDQIFTHPVIAEQLSNLFGMEDN